MVCGKLHYEGRGIARKHFGLLEHNTGYDDRCHTDEVSGGGNKCASAEECTGDHCDKGNLCAAGDECRGHDRHTAVTLILDSARSHDSGNAASRTDKHRDEALSGETELAEYTVKDECDTRHVAACLKECKKQEEDEHLRNESENGADAGYDTVDD